MALSNAAKSDIEKFDVNLDNSIQLNSSKVPAQQGIFSLVISAGGTGRDALLETKGMINKTCCLSLDAKDQPTRNVAYRCFDTDAASLNQCSSSRSGGAKLSERDGEFVRMEAPNIATYLSTAFRSQVPNYVSEWLDFRIDPTINGSDGAGGVRQCGRLLMFQNVDRIRESIASAIRTMTAGQEVIRLNIYVMVWAAVPAAVPSWIWPTSPAMWPRASCPTRSPLTATSSCRTSTSAVRFPKRPVLISAATAMPPCVSWITP